MNSQSLIYLAKNLLASPQTVGEFEYLSINLTMHRKMIIFVKSLYN